MADDLDCRSCGACCGPEFDEPTYASVSRTDVERLPRHALRRLVVLRKGDGAMRTKRVKRDGVVCAALEGRRGQQCSCSIYDARPDACREFERGGDACHHARRWFALEAYGA